MKTLRNHGFTVLVLCVLAAGCGTAPTYQRLQVRPGYTTDHVVAAFEERYAVPEREAPSGEVRIDGEPTVYRTIHQAVAEADDGATILVGPGIYRESVVVQNKKVHLRGAGAGQSIVLAQETALYANQATVTVVGLGLWSLTVGPDVGVVALTRTRAHLTDCRVSGGTGPGLLIAGPDSRVTLAGNLVKGNMGGGVRVQGGRVRLLRNVVVTNAVAGIVLAPSAPDAIGSFSLWHDTVLDNWGGHRCVSFARSGVVPLGPERRYRIEAAVLNSAGLGETFSEAFFGRIKQQGRNFISATPLPAPKFFINPQADDYRPRGALVEDDIGLEVGALPSPAGEKKIRKVLDNALVSEKLQLAYLVSLFLPLAQRDEVHERIKQVLYNWTADYLKYQRLGTRLFAALGLARVAPSHWRLEVILERFLEGFVARYTYALRPLNFFPDNTELAARVEANLQGSASLIPRFVVKGTQSPNAFVMSGRVKKPLEPTQTVRAFEVKRTVTNPYFDKLKDAVTMLASRKEEKAKKIEDIRFTLENPHFGSRKKYRASLEKKRERLEKDLARIEEQLAQARQRQEAAVAQYDLVVRGRITDTLVKGTIFVTFVVAPDGQILLDTTREMDFRHTRVQVDPMAEFNLPGQELSGEFARPEDQAANRISDMMLRALIKEETRELSRLLELFKRGAIDNEGEDRLVELLLLNAPLFKESRARRTEYEALQKQTRTTAGDLAVEAGYDPAKGEGPAGVTLTVEYIDSDRVGKRMAELEAVFKPYWELLDLVEHFVRTRYGISLKLFFETRRVLERLITLPAASE